VFPKIPVTRPSDEPMVAMPASEDVHVPLGVAFVSVVVVPTQTLAVPLILAGAAETVNSPTAVHPLLV